MHEQAILLAARRERGRRSIGLGIEVVTGTLTSSPSLALFFADRLNVIGHWSMNGPIRHSPNMVPPRYCLPIATPPRSEIVTVGDGAAHDACRCELETCEKLLACSFAHFP